jgi:hypothetical protein
LKNLIAEGGVEVVAERAVLIQARKNRYRHLPGGCLEAVHDPAQKGLKTLLHN